MPIDEYYDKYRVFREPDHDRLQHDKLNPVPFHAEFMAEETSEYEVWEDAQEIEGFFFVLRPEKDHHARVALAAYIASCKEELPNLSADLEILLAGAYYRVESGEDPDPPFEPEELELKAQKLRIVK